MRLLMLLIGLMLLCAPADAASGRLVVVTVGGASLDDILRPELGNISRLIEIGAIGVMNARPASGRIVDDTDVGGYSMEGGCAAISSGTRAAATVDARSAYSSWEKTVERRPAQELYASFYGKSPGRAEVLHMGMNSLRFANEDARYPVEIGGVGTSLHRAGLRTAAIGNSDIPAVPHREAALIAADDDGIVDYGDVSSKFVVHDPAAPYGVRTDTARLISKFRQSADKADFIVVDVGDTARAASYAGYCLEEQGTSHMRRAMRTADAVIGGILKEIDLSRDRIILLSPNPSVDEFNFLPPVIAAGAGVSHGLLWSGSTRRKGIITNADISASILDFFGVDAPYSFVGRPTNSAEGSARDLADLNRRIRLQMERQPIMRGIAIFLTVYVIILTAYALLRRDASAWASWAALVPVTVFLAVLWLPAFVNFALIGTVIALPVLIVAILVAACMALRSAGRAFGWICGCVVLSAVLDLIGGPVLLRDSVMSYTPAGGSRYYGIGNEHMGSLIGAAVIGGGILADALGGSRRLKIPLVASLLTIVALMIGLPSYGANAGGAISAVASVVAVVMLWTGRRVRPAHVALAAAVIAASIALVLLVDSLRSTGEQSHVARAARLITAGGPKEAAIVIGRKLEMNMLLLRYSAWSKLLFACIAGIVAALSSQRLRVLDRLNKDGYIVSAIIAAGVGVGAALIFNDSGVVAAATAAVYVWTVILLTALPYQTKGSKSA
ncbi:MAG: hypothetical protein HYX78_11325 [Armatimonadetes bacterium]|nr:hypothetical protein [Armatimonadota bacterium]